MKSKTKYPPLPDKRCFTIGEAAQLALVKPYTVRYWEKNIPQLALATQWRRGRRYYSVDDVLLLRRVYSLLKDKGYTIGGIGGALAGGGEAAKNKKSIWLRREIERIMAML